MKILTEVLNALVAHARQAAPIEACGYLAQRDDTIVAHYPLRNTDDSGEHFTMDPTEQFTVIRQMRSLGQKAVAVYHSHPASAAQPSPEDIRLAHDPQISYVIVSLAGETPEVKSFRIRNGVVDPETIEII
jgi:proteasome lid subunit RPN8/RPN11